MRRFHATMFCALSAVSPAAATAQPDAALDSDASYQTILALIDEMVDNKLIGRGQADKMLANARAKAARALAAHSQMAAAAPPPPRPVPSAASVPAASGIAPPPPRAAELVLRSPEPVSRIAPVQAGNVQVAGASAEGITLPADLNVDWSRGAPVFTSRDGRFSFKLRGRILADISSTSGSAFDSRNITVSALRQFRFGGVGTVGPHIFYQFEADFRRNATEVVNTFIGYRERFGKVDTDIRAGNIITDRGIDVGTAATANPLITTNINTTALSPQNGKVYFMGVAARAGQKNWHASLSILGDTIDNDFARTDNRTLLARAHWNPILTTKGLIHVGGWAYDEHIPAATASVAVNQGISGALNALTRVESKTLTGAAGSRAYGFELGGTYGPFYAFGEYGVRRVSSRPGAAFGHATYKALSVNGGVWLTGEKPTYTSTSGTYVAPSIRHSTMSGGWGGVELVARYEDMDASGAPLGGTGTAATIGANWYLTNNVRLMADFIRWETDNLTGAYLGQDRGNTVAARAEIAF